MFEKEKRETPYRGRATDGVSPRRLSEGSHGKRGRKRFLAALEMTVWGMDIPMTARGKWIPAVSYKVFAGEALIP